MLCVLNARSIEAIRRQPNITVYLIRGNSQSSPPDLFYIAVLNFMISSFIHINQNLEEVDLWEKKER